ncbi:MAG: hypothetical protein A2V64_11425 [Bacteroidetes bacterium RBG_13_43_22]|nr:MAG: hypothetical protein A2V64_11425 [Bacteroidetes bacterium RBG_13_43_22]
MIAIAIAALEGQDVTVTAVFDSTRIYIGDQINYTITVDQPFGLELDLPLLKDTLSGKIEILSGPVIDSNAVDNDRLRITSRYLITSFDSGFYEVPPTYAEIKNESGIKRYYSGYSPLEVMRVKIAPADTSARIFDIIGPYKAPLTLGEILPWILLAALAAALIWGIIRLVRKLRKPKTEPETLINPDPAHVIAFRDLEKLRDEQLWQKGEVKQYYSRLTEILRQYLENRYGVYSLEMTTSETLEALLKTGFKKDSSYSSLKTILNGSDLVKFAKYKPEPSENDVHFQNSWAFVDATKYIPEPEPDKETKKTSEKK